MGWPRIGQAVDALEPWLFLPALFIFMWLADLLQRRTLLSTWVNLMLAAVLTIVIFSVYCIGSVWIQGKDEVLKE